MAAWELNQAMSRVAGQIGKIVMRTAQVVAGTLTPSHTGQASARFGRNRLVDNKQNMLGGMGLGGRAAVPLVKGIIIRE